MSGHKIARGLYTCGDLNSATTAFSAIVEHLKNKRVDGSKEYDRENIFQMIEILKEYSSERDEKFIFLALKAIALACTGDFADNREAAGLCGGLATIVEVTRNNGIGSMVIAEWGLNAIATLACACSFNKTEFIRYGAAELVLSLLRTHVSTRSVHQKVAYLGAMALGNLCDNQSPGHPNKNRLNRIGAPQVLKALVLQNSWVYGEAKEEAASAIYKIETRLPSWFPGTARR